MKATTETKHQVTLVLNEEEADWLHGVMQNPMYEESVSSESKLDADMRSKFFNATKPAKLPEMGGNRDIMDGHPN